MRNNIFALTDDMTRAQKIVQLASILRAKYYHKMEQSAIGINADGKLTSKYSKEVKRLNRVLSGYLDRKIK